MANPIPLTTDGSGPEGAIPVEIYGDSGSGGDVAWADITGKPTTFAPIIGTAANQAMAGNTVIPAAATWANIAGKPAVIAAGSDAAAARAAIGAGTGNGTSNLAVATTSPAALASAAAVGTATTAARADHVHPFPTAAQIGAASTSHTQAATTVTVAAGEGIVGANVQAVLADLAARIVALESA